MNDPRLTEEIMNQERSRSWLMNPPPSQTTPLATHEPEPDPAPAHEPAAPSRLTKEQVNEVRRKASLLRWARWRERRQGEAATETAAGKSDHSQIQARYWARLSPEERSAEVRKRMAARKAKPLASAGEQVKANGQPAAQVTDQSAEMPKASHSLVQQLQAIQDKGEQLAKAAADLLGLIIH